MSATTRERRRRRPARDDEADAEVHEFNAASAPRRGARRTVFRAISQLPHYLRLLVGLMRDGRVSAADKLLVAGAIAYIVSPLDLVPDVIPFLGQVDDIFLLVTALQRLIAHAGRRVLRDHWHGDRSELRDLNLKATLGAAAFFLPGRIRRSLRRFARRRR